MTLAEVMLRSLAGSLSLSLAALAFISYSKINPESEAFNASRHKTTRDGHGTVGKNI